MKSVSRSIAAPTRSLTRSPARRAGALAFTLALALVLGTLGNTAFAHEGHGAAAPHIHPTDTLGLLVLAAVAGVGAWLWLRGRR